MEPCRVAEQRRWTDQVAGLSSDAFEEPEEEARPEDMDIDVNMNESHAVHAGGEVQEGDDDELDLQGRRELLVAAMNEFGFGGEADDDEEEEDQEVVPGPVEQGAATSKYRFERHPTAGRHRPSENPQLPPKKPKPFTGLEKRVLDFAFLTAKLTTSAFEKLVSILCDVANKPSKFRFRSAAGMVEELDKCYPSLNMKQVVITSEMFGPNMDERQRKLIDSERPVFLYRSPLAVIRDIFADPKLVDALITAPAKMIDVETGKRAYGQVHTGTHWEEKQAVVDRRETGGTIAGIMAYSDGTLVSNFGHLSAHPVGMSLANVPRHIRNVSGIKLLAYIPELRPAKSVRDQDWYTVLYRSLLQVCFAILFKDLEEASKNGVDMPDYLGRIYRVFPMLFKWIGDYKEQVMIALTRSGGQTLRGSVCCNIENTLLHDLNQRCSDHTPRTQAELKTLARMAKETRDETTKKDATTFMQQFGISECLVPHFLEGMDTETNDIFTAMTVDTVHAMDGGVFGDHLMPMTLDRITANRGQAGLRILDERASDVDPYPGKRDFNEGFSNLSYLASRDLLTICIILLPLIIDLVDEDILAALRDYIRYRFDILARICDESKLAKMEAHLRSLASSILVFRQFSKSSLNFVKMHAITRYPAETVAFGTSDNQDSQRSESAHGKMVKQVYLLTNKKDPLPQMAKKITRIDKCARLLEEGKPKDPPEPKRAKSRVCFGSPANKLVDLRTLYSNPNALQQAIRAHLDNRVNGGRSRHLRDWPAIENFTVRTYSALYFYGEVDESGEQEREILRVSKRFFGRPRNDAVLYRNPQDPQGIGRSGYSVGRLEFLIQMTFGGEQLLLAALRRHHSPTPVSSIGYWRVEADQTDKPSSLIVVGAESLVRGALLQPDYRSEPLAPGKYPAYFVSPFIDRYMVDVLPEI